MSFFDLFKKTKKKELSESDQKWNLMWDMWAQGETVSPYTELMEYDGEVNNGGHAQYFSNIADNADNLEAVLDILCSAMPQPLPDNLKKGYEAFTVQESACDEDDALIEKCDVLLNECDSIFFENENLILDILRGYADSLSL